MSTVPSIAFTWQQGEDGEINAVFKENDLPVDLTGWQARMDVRSDAGALLTTLNSDDVDEAGYDEVGEADNEITLGADGTISVEIPRSLTLGEGSLVPSLGTTMLFDLFLRSPEGKNRKILKGSITVEESSTRWA